MAVETTTTFAPALKTLWPQSRYLSAVYKNNPALALLRKMEKFTGKNLVLAVRYSDGQGRSSSFSKAQTNKSATAGAAFTLTRAKDYWLGSVDTETILASKDDPGALAEALDTNSEAGMNAITRSLAVKVYGDGTGAIGKSASHSSNTVTLTNPGDVTNFEVGMVVDADPTKTGASGSLRGTAKVTNVDRVAGTVTFDSITASDNDYLYVDGDYDAPIKGFQAWCPASAPASTSFFGVDRSVDSRLGGLRYDISAMSPEEGLVKAIYLQDREGGVADYVFYNPVDFINVQHALGSKVHYETLSVGEIAFEAIRVNGPKKPVKLISDYNCPQAMGFSLEMSSWALYSLGKAPRILNIDGLELLREYNADANEMRIAYYAQLGCEIPGHNANLTLPS